MQTIQDNQDNQDIQDIQDIDTSIQNELIEIIARNY
jgi:archaellum component FlaC